MDNMGLPVASSLPLVGGKLTSAGLRERNKLIASGKMINPAGVAAALCLGADVVCSARGFMFSLGCIQALQCNENTCPTGITTREAGRDGGDGEHRGDDLVDADDLVGAEAVLAHAGAGHAGAVVDPVGHRREEGLVLREQQLHV